MSETKKVRRREYFPADEPSFEEKKNKIIKDLNELKKMLQEIRESMLNDVNMSIERAHAESITKNVLDGVLAAL